MQKSLFPLTSKHKQEKNVEMLSKPIYTNLLITASATIPVLLLCLMLVSMGREGIKERFLSIYKY